MKVEFLVLPFTLFFLALLISVSAQPSVCDWRGYSKIDNSIANSSYFVTSYTNDSSATNGTIYSSGYYIVHVPGVNGNNVTLKICGVNTNQTLQTWSCGGDGYNILNISINTSANGVSCTASCGCTSTFCVHGTCRAASTYCGDGFCDSGETTSSCSADCGSAPGTPSTSTGGGETVPSGKKETPPTKEEAPPAEKAKPAAPEGVAITPVDVVVTGTAEISEVLTGVKAEDLGVTELSVEKVEVKKTGTAEAETKVETQAVVDAIDKVLPQATEEAKTVLSEIKSSISAETSQPILVSTKLEVFQVTEKETKKTADVSKVTLSFKAEKDLKDVNIVQVIPKSVAASILDVIFPGEKPKILQADPVVQWAFDTVSKGEEKNLSYIVKKKLDRLNTTTVAAAAAEKPPVTVPKVAVPNEVYYIVGIIVIAIVVYIFRDRITKSVKKIRPVKKKS